jgi:hypothetical protein
MKSLIKSAWLIMGLAATFSTAIPQVRGGTVPAFSDLSFGGVTTAGLDGNLRLLFNSFTGVDGTGTYLASDIWTVSPFGRVVSATVTAIPSSVGSPFNIFVQGQADGNTTALFVFPNDSIGVWTYNTGGSIIASAVYGPFTNTFVNTVKRQDTTGKFLVVWNSSTSSGPIVSAWTINEFGGIETAAGPFGPFGSGTVSEGVNLLKDGTQEWVWESPVSGGVITALWTVNPTTGKIVTAQQFGPF